MAYMLYGRETFPVDYDPGPMMVDSLGAAPVTGIKINKPMTERAGRVILEDASHYYVGLADDELPEELYLGDIVVIPVRQGIGEGLGFFGSFFKKAFKKIKKGVFHAYPHSPHHWFRHHRRAHVRSI
jgi:hypothetical protein